MFVLGVVLTLPFRTIPESPQFGRHVRTGYLLTPQS